MRASTISAITKANPGQVTTTVAHNFVNGDRVYITGVGGMTQINGLTVSVTVVNATNFTIGLDTSGAGFSAYTSGGATSRLVALTSSGTWAAGSATVAAAVRLERSPAPDGPFTTLRVGIAPRDSDGISLLTGLLDLDADANSSNDSFTVGTTELRFGRLRLYNAFGSSLLDLPLPLSTQYYDGSFFVTNTADSCTTIAASDIAFNFVGPNLAACETHLNPAGALAFASGKLEVKLTKPGNSNNGAVDLTVNLGAAPSGSTCTSATSSAATAANKTWFQGNWGTGTYTDNPRGRATFGIFKNADQFLYFREVY
jgi:MSHA biogenesis protein MshQ